jgi:hypothetical protein
MRVCDNCQNDCKDRLPFPCPDWYPQPFEAPPESTRAGQMFEDFLSFHHANPQVWELFKKYTFQALRVGHRRYSSRTILHLIRWHEDVETVGAGKLFDGTELKINNNHSPWYARVFMTVYPEWSGFFRNRELLSMYTPAWRPIPVEDMKQWLHQKEG